MTVVILASLFVSTSHALDSASDNVLYIGDSHSVNEKMRTELQGSLGNKVTYHASCGSNALHWAKGGYTSRCGQYNADPTPSLERLMIKEKPSKVVIELGDNHFEWDGRNPHRATAVHKHTERYVKALLASLDEHTPCYWVGPTWGSRGRDYFKSDEMVEAMYATLKKAVEPRCQIVDCRNAVSRSSRGDGLHHHNDEAAKAWAACIVDKTNPSETGENSATTVNH